MKQCPMLQSYDQPEKRAVREAVWIDAIGGLTGNRTLSSVVQESELLDTLEYAIRVLQLDPRGRSEVEAEFEGWRDCFRASVGTRRPDELRVLYLCGPEPLNDLNEMLAHGVHHQNVWAVENAQPNFAAALAQLERSGTPLKVHHGELAEFLDLFTGTFDIVYYDACGPFVGGKPGTLNPLLSLLLHARLEPVSVLITNYAQVPTDQVERYARLMASYFRFRHRDLPKAFWDAKLEPIECAIDSSELEGVIGQDTGPFYSEFITRLTTDLARSLLPNCRALANRGIARSHMAESEKLKNAIASALHEPQAAASLQEWLANVGDIVLNPSGYPILSFLRAIAYLNPPDPLASQLGNLKVKGQEVHRLIAMAAVLEKVVEGHWAVLGEELSSAIEASWFDVGNPFSCDSPLPNLLVNALLGIYGRPYFPNPRATNRYLYTAKRTTMFTDIITFDQCRYFYDWFPVVQAVSSRFRSLAFQVLARCILDRIGRADWSSEAHPFQGSAVVGLCETPTAEFYDFMPRKLLPAVKF